ncbi:hypothetical protein EXIGLDRAFT_840102 [Exidia glandulosa HHB12029]|uniref:Uncharacterized protein n=1 Tax=Exidia glandulosa HHB12029 TaxID=1314781 RepID=A0A165EMT7_EXIGL|nr:hypothetical protein EXIGLDRAFT_840102 [Exidia glandulosa HHB12029]
MKPSREMTPLFAESAATSARASPLTVSDNDISVSSNQKFQGPSTSRPVATGTREHSFTEEARTHVTPEQEGGSTDQNEDEAPPHPAGHETQPNETSAHAQGARARRAAREVTYEILHAPPELVSAFKDARAKYHEAIFAWWHRKPRRKGETPTDDDWERVKRDPKVQEAGRVLDALDAELSRAGSLVRISTLKNDRTVQRQIRVEERQLDKEFYARQAEENGTIAYERPSKRRKLADGQDGRRSAEIGTDEIASARSAESGGNPKVQSRAHSPEPTDGARTREGSARRSLRGKAATDTQLD